MGIDFIERRIRRSSGGGGGANGVISNGTTTTRIINHQEHNHNHNYSRTSQLNEDNGFQNGNYYQTKIPGDYQSGSVTRHNVTSPMGKPYLSYVSSPTYMNGEDRFKNTGDQYTNPPSLASSSTTSSGALSCSTSSTSTTQSPAKPSRTLSVRNFSNFVKRLPSLTLSPSVRIASSLGFSSSNSNSTHSSEKSNGKNANHSPPQSNGATATLKRPTSVSFQKKKARPFSYAEPGSLTNGNHFNDNVKLRNGKSNDHLAISPPPISSPKGRLENIGNDGATYNGHNVADLEARLARLRYQQRERRKSLDFAISCVEPDPTCFSVEEQV